MIIKKFETNIKRKLYLHESIIDVSPTSDFIENNIISIKPEFAYQEFLGFGGAFTQSTRLCFKYS